MCGNCVRLLPPQGVNKGLCQHRWWCKEWFRVSIMHQGGMNCLVAWIARSRTIGTGIAKATTFSSRPSTTGWDSMLRRGMFESKWLSGGRSAIAWFSKSLSRAGNNFCRDRKLYGDSANLGEWLGISIELLLISSSVLCSDDPSRLPYTT